MTSDAAADLTAEIKKLRKGAGLVPPKLAASPRLMEALGGLPTHEAYAKIVAMVRQLGDGTPARAIRAALALDFSEHHFVKTRREFFGSTIGRHDEGTIIGYEDVAISQLVANLLNQLPVEQPEQYTLLCFGTYRNRQLLNVATGTISNDAWEGGAAMSTGQPYLEMSSWRPAESTSALSLLLYQLPPDQRPWRVALGVQFLEEPFPQRVSSFTGSTLFGLAALEEGFKDFEPDRPGFYVTSWSDVIPGYYFGLIWS